MSVTSCLEAKSTSLTATCSLCPATTGVTPGGGQDPDCRRRMERPKSITEGKNQTRPKASIGLVTAPQYLLMGFPATQKIARYTATVMATRLPIPDLQPARPKSIAGKKSAEAQSGRPSKRLMRIVVNTK